MPEPDTAEAKALTPADVLLASNALGNVHNAEISAYLSAHPAATFGHIYRALRDRGIDVVRGTLSARLRNMEATGIITGDPASERGRGKVVRYSLDAHRLNQLASHQLDYMLGLTDEATASTVSSDLRPLDTVSAKILTYLARHDSSTTDELHEELKESSSPQRLTDLTTIGLVMIDDDRVQLDRPAVARAARVLFEASVQ